jgi:hypothetical protein
MREAAAVRNSRVGGRSRFGVNLSGLFLFLLLSCAITPVAASQERAIDFGSDPMGSTGYTVKWDSANDRLVLLRDVDVSAAPAARTLSWDGTEIATYPLKDLPEALSVTTWAAAAAPNGGMVLAIIANYGPAGAKRPVARSLLLTYDSRGELTKVWNVNPYHYHQLAVDQEGNVFGFGDRMDAASGLNYPLIVKYSPSGSVEAEFLPSGLFPSGDEVVSSGSSHGESQLFVRDQELFLWLAPSEELLRFSLNGSLKSRVFLHAALTSVAGGMGGSRTRVECLGISGAEILAQVQVWPKAGVGGVTFGMVKISPDGSQANALGPFSDAPVPGRFLGTTAAGKTVFLDERLGIIRQY